MSWYICTVVAVLFLVARIWVRLRRFGKLGLDDGFLVLATACLIGDCGIQQHMWNEGVADLGNASRANFVEIMKVNSPPLLHEAHRTDRASPDDHPRIDPLCYIPVGHQGRSCALLQEARGAELEAANRLQRHTLRAGRNMGGHLLRYHLPVLPE